MVDPTTISGLASSLASATQVTKAILGMKVDSEVKAAIIGLQNSLIMAQNSALASLGEREVLQNKVDEL